jgi:hypothetical protein
MNLKTDLISLSDTERAILMGSLLGDGTLQKRGLNSFRHRVSHSISQKSYVEWKYEKLNRLCQTTQPPKEVTNTKGYVSVEFYTSSGEYLKELFELFYKKSSFSASKKAETKSDKFLKTITPELIENLPLDPILLAVWFMDDGSARNDCYAGNLATQCFSLEEHHLLKDYFQKWDLDCNIVKHSTQKQTYYLYFPRRSFPKLVSIIESTVKEIPDMIYKLNEDRKP